MCASRYGKQHSHEVKEQIKEGTFLSRPNECPEEIYEMMLSCWRMEPTARPTFTSIRGAFSSEPFAPRTPRLVYP